MSKAKVEEYKNYKKNKKKILAKEKRKKVAANVILKLVGILIVAGVLFLVCYKGIDMYKSYLASQPDYSSTGFILGDMCDLKGEAHDHDHDHDHEEEEEETTTDAAEETTALDETSATE